MHSVLTRHAQERRLLFNVQEAEGVQIVCPLYTPTSNFRDVVSETRLSESALVSILPRRNIAVSLLTCSAFIGRFIIDMCSLNTMDK
jgi:hypothetical protein